MGNAMNTHGEWGPKFLDMFGDSLLAPSNIETPYAPKHRNFLDSCYLLNPPLTSNAFIMTLVKLLEKDPLTTL
jgi:hypothetical protein